MLHEVNLQLFAQESVHGTVYKGVGNGFFCLVLIGSLSRKAVDDQHKAVLNILKRDARLVLLVLLACPQELIHRVHERRADCLVR